MAGGGRCRLLSLPDKLLSAILCRVLHPLDRFSVSHTCKRLHGLLRGTPYALRLELLWSRRPNTTIRDWLQELSDFSLVFSCITMLVVDINVDMGNELLAGIGSSCPKLEQLKLAVVQGIFNTTPAAWRTLAKNCPLLNKLELDDPFARPTDESSSEPRHFPFDAVPALQTLNLLFPAEDVPSLPRCSALTSLIIRKPSRTTLFSLASSSSAARISLQYLCVISAGLIGSLACFSCFPNLTELAFNACIFNPSEVIALSRSITTLTRLAAADCPSVCSRIVAAIVQSNPGLSLLELASSSYHLFSPRGLSTMLQSSRPKLQTLILVRLPSFRPGMLADCSSLRCLTVQMGEGSLEGLVGMLVRVEEKGAEEGRKEEYSVTPPSAVSSIGGNLMGGRRQYVDIRTAAAAAHADRVSSFNDAVSLIDRAKEGLEVICFEADNARESDSEHKIRRAIAGAGLVGSLCKSAYLGICDANEARAREILMKRKFAAAQGLGFFHCGVQRRRHRGRRSCS
ncbi:hypothetical protein CLOM_g22100 [Closterium sp. NIES-68]|nr:hypothetical protein CLOM_g22100 [Closterium sp. NIES-68]GJP74443.1 hypothetical protein CLOP_g5023 [Closterium sp. NIES-67]